MVEITSGLPAAPLWIVGQAPGKAEVSRKRPFVGPSGQVLRRVLQSVGIDDKAAFFTNVAHEMPDGHALGNLSQVSRDFGQRALDKHLRENKPKLILALGGDALNALTGKNGIMSCRGFPKRTTIGKHLVLPCFHPSYCLRVPKSSIILTKDLDKAATILKQGLPEEPPHKISRLLSCREILKGLSFWGRGEVAALDTEFIYNRITGVSFCVKKDNVYHAFAFPLVNQDFTPRFNLKEMTLIFGALHGHLASSPIVGHNLYSDETLLAGYTGTFIQNLEMDTMIAHHLKYGMLPRGLEFCASIYLPYAKGWKFGRGDWAFPRATLDDFLQYSAKDALVTYQVYEAIKADGLPKQHQSYTKDIYPVMRTAMFRGIKVDTKRREAIQKAYSEDAEANNKRINEIFKVSLNLSSPKQVSSFIADKTNNKFGESTSPQALKKAKEETPEIEKFVDMLSRYRKTNAMRRTALSAELVDNRFVTEFKLAAASTYRFSSAKSITGFGGNLQNIPQGRSIPEGLPPVREMFVPDEGYAFLEFDLGGADAQVVAWDSGDPELKQAFRDNIDVHQMNADALGCTRQIAKGFVHGTNYGGGAKRISEACNLPIQQIREMQIQWFNKHPKIRLWQNRLKAEVAQRSYLENRLGYRGYFYAFCDVSPGDFLPFIPQSTVANIINIGIVQAVKAFPYIKLLAQIHDSGLFLVPLDRVKDWREIAEVMTVDIPYEDKLRVPLSVKFSTTNLAEMRDLDDTT